VDLGCFGETEHSNMEIQIYQRFALMAVPDCFESTITHQFRTRFNQFLPFGFCYAFIETLYPSHWNCVFGRESLFFSI